MVEVNVVLVRFAFWLRPKSVVGLQWRVIGTGAFIGICLFQHLFEELDWLATRPLSTADDYQKLVSDRFVTLKFGFKSDSKGVLATCD